MDSEPRPEPLHFDYPDVRNATQVVVIGAGPAISLRHYDSLSWDCAPSCWSVGAMLCNEKKDVVEINRGGEICKLQLRLWGGRGRYIL